MTSVSGMDILKIRNALSNIFRANDFLGVVIGTQLEFHIVVFLAAGMHGCVAYPSVIGSLEAIQKFIDKL